MPNALVEQYELVREVHYVFENIEPKIKGRIYKIILGAQAKYTWSVNFYCALQDQHDVYIPGAPYGDSLEEAEIKLSEYIQRFENAVNWRANDYF